MTPGKVSVLIPSRNELFLGKTVADLLAKAVDDLEICVALEGYWPNPPLPDDKRIKILHTGQPQGMRSAINSLVHISTGEFLMKVDAHVSVEHGFDSIMKSDYLEDNWILVPRRDRLDAENWCRQDVGKPPIDCHFLSNGIERPDDPRCGLHGTNFPSRAKQRTHILLDEDLSSQGSFWMMRRSLWDQIGPMDPTYLGQFTNEAQELGLRLQLGPMAGKFMVTKRTTYLHLHKSVRHKYYSLKHEGTEKGKLWCTWFWMTDQWPERIHDLKWLIQKWMPLPTWGPDPEAVFHRARQILKNPHSVVSS